MKRSSKCLKLIENAEPAHKRQRLSLSDHSTDNTNNHTWGIDKKSCRQQLNTILFNISKFGKLSVSGNGKKYLPDVCGLHINGIGSVPLPLCSLVANVIFNLPHCTTVGVGHQTESKQDENINKVYEIDSTQFKFENNTFNEGIFRLVNKVGLDLGIRNENLKYISYEQEKLLIFDSNDEFVLRCDNTEQLPKFATHNSVAIKIFNGK